MTELEFRGWRDEGVVINYPLCIQSESYIRRNFEVFNEFSKYMRKIVYYDEVFGLYYVMLIKKTSYAVNQYLMFFKHDKNVDCV